MKDAAAPVYDGSFFLRNEALESNTSDALRERYQRLYSAVGHGHIPNDEHRITVKTLPSRLQACHVQAYHARYNFLQLVEAYKASLWQTGPTSLQYVRNSYQGLAEDVRKAWPQVVRLSDPNRGTLELDLI